MKEFIFCVGLPGCGKSTYLENTYSPYHAVKAFQSYHDCIDERMDKSYDSVAEFLMSQHANETVIISADEFKESLAGYDCNHPEKVHERSVQIAKRCIFELVDKAYPGTVILDGGGINKSYNKSIIEYVREHSPETKITCLFFDTPIEVCLKRIESRERKVPVEDIFAKNLKLISCVNRYIPMVDEFKRVNYYTSERIFLDMDGTIAAYARSKYDIHGNKDFCCGELFLHLRPVKHVIEFIKEHFDLNNVYVCSAVANSVVWDEKNKWLDKYFPEIPKENRLFVGNKDYKHVFVANYCAMQNWPINTVTLIDDYHDTIHKCEKLGINCIHPSNIEALVDPTMYMG